MGEGEAFREVLVRQDNTIEPAILGPPIFLLPREKPRVTKTQGEAQKV